MVHLIYSVLIILLLVIVYYQYQKNNEKLKLISKEKGKQEIKYEKLHSEHEIKDSKLETYKKENDNLISNNNRLRKELNIIKNSNVNVGEKMAALQIEGILNNLLENNVIDFKYSFNNIIIFDGEEPRQIDHLVICNKGCYIIETKNWKGDIFYNVNEKSLRDKGYGVFARYIFNDKTQNTHKTFVIRTSENGSIDYQDYGHPFKQVMKTTMVLHNKIKELLGRSVFVNGIVYFNYDSNQKYDFVDGTKGEKSKVSVANQMDGLEDVFLKHIESKESGNITQKAAEDYVRILKNYAV